MLKKYSFFFAIVVLLFIALPVSQTIFLKSSAVSSLKGPLVFSKGIAQGVTNLFYFQKNAYENNELRNRLAGVRFNQFQHEELIQENARLTRLLNIKQVTPSMIHETVFARVISRSPNAWNKVFLIDKGTRQGVKLHMSVMTESSLIGKIVEVYPSASKVLLITDPNCKVGALVQRTRHQGLLYGTSKGECRMKYISQDAELHPGDFIETAGFAGFMPKGIRIGSVQKIWKEPGQIYQVASVKPLVDLGTVEEVVCVD